MTGLIIPCPSTPISNIVRPVNASNIMDYNTPSTAVPIPPVNPVKATTPTKVTPFLTHIKTRIVSG